MDFVSNTVNGIYNWEFLQEPLNRWFLFFGASLAMMYAWGVILAFMH